MICSYKPNILLIMTFITNAFGKTTSEKNCEELEDINHTEDNIVYEFDRFENEDYDVVNDCYSSVRIFHSNTYNMMDEKYDGSKFIVRISGCKFETITQCLQPHDKSIRECFIETTKDLIEKYNAQCGWTMGDNILLFFDYDQNSNESIASNTETVITEIASYATIRFDKHLNASIDKLVERYSVEIVADLINQDPVFRTILINPNDPEYLVEYMYYITERVDNIEESGDFGIIVKPYINDKKEAGCTYRYVYAQDEDKMFDLDFIMKPYINLISKEE